MRKLLAIFLFAGLLTGCVDKKDKNSDTSKKETTEQKEVKYDKVDGVAVDMDNKGVGPVTSVSLDEEIDEALVKTGKEIYDRNCLACHKPDKKFVGPAPKGVLDRRAPEWVMNMIINPEKMVKEDPVAKQLLIEYNGSPMANQGITEDEARAILEYFRTL